MTRKIRNYENISSELQAKYGINRNVTLEEIGEFLNDCLDYQDDSDTQTELDCLRSAINGMHMKLFPNAWRTPTAENERNMIFQLLNGAIVEINKKDTDTSYATLLIGEACAKLEDLTLH